MTRLMKAPPVHIKNQMPIYLKILWHYYCFQIKIRDVLDLSTSISNHITDSYKIVIRYKMITFSSQCVIVRQTYVFKFYLK